MACGCKDTDRELAKLVDAGVKLNRAELLRKLREGHRMLKYVATPPDIPEGVRSVFIFSKEYKVLRLELLKCSDGCVIDKLDWDGVNATAEDERYITDKGWITIEVKNDIPKGASGAPHSKVYWAKNEKGGLSANVIFRPLSNVNLEFEYDEENDVVLFPAKSGYFENGTGFFVNGSVIAPERTAKDVYKEKYEAEDYKEAFEYGISLIENDTTISDEVRERRLAIFRKMMSEWA